MSEATCKRHGIQKDLGGDVDVGVKLEPHGFCCGAFTRGFLKWWYPTTLDFPTKTIILGYFGGTTATI